MHDIKIQCIATEFTFKDLKGLLCFLLKKKINPDAHFKGENTRLEK